MWLCTFSYIKLFSASGEAILGTQRYLEARFSTIAVYNLDVFLLVEDDRVSKNHSMFALVL